jgi:very-long-chain (3R)-3-hydroxyacyl-CoA dehydratase
MSSTPQSRPQRPPPTASTATSRYLLAYNTLSLTLWSTVTLRALLLIPTLLAHQKLYGLLDALLPLLTYVQSLAVLEIIHSLLGLVRASPLTTLMQVSSRLFLVWGVLQPYPQIVSTVNTFKRHVAGLPGGQYAFAGLLVAWGVTEIIRYGFFAYSLGLSSRVPTWLSWLRYNTFFVLYPLGISSECWLIWLAITAAQKLQHGGMDLLYKAVLLIYVPGSYILYTHMMAQRRKVAKGKGKTI